MRNTYVISFKAYIFFVIFEVLAVLQLVSNLFQNLEQPVVTYFMRTIDCVLELQYITTRYVPFTLFLLVFRLKILWKYFLLEVVFNLYVLLYLMFPFIFSRSISCSFS